VTATLRSTSVAVRGIRSPILQAGPSDATEAAVFVHGSPGGGDDWSDLLGQVGDFARALAPDMPGYAGADSPTDFSYTVEGYAEHLGGLLDELAIRRVHLVVHGFGGPWALAWGVRHPAALASVTLINTGVLIDYHWRRYAKLWRTPIVGEVAMAQATRSGFRWLVGRDNPRLYPDAIDRIYAHFHPRSARRAILKLYRATPAKMLGNSSRALRTLDRPALVIWGTYDAYIQWDQAERQRQSFPSARLELLEGLGHWPLFEDPWRVASLVVPFLREQIGVQSGLQAST